MNSSIKACAARVGTRTSTDTRASAGTVLHAGHGGLLHMGAFATADISLVPTALRALQHDRPDVDVVAVEGSTGTLMARLADGALDLAVVSDYPSGLPSAEGVTTAVLCEDE